MPVSCEELIPVGRITATHGIRGQLKLKSYSGNYESLKNAATLTVCLDNGTTENLSVKRVSANGNYFLLSFADFDNIDQVTHLLGGEVCLYRSQLPEPGDDEYYWCDLIGIKVVTVDGIFLGTLTEILETGANDVYLVKGQNSEYMLPATASVISSVDLNARIMTVTPLEGLLEL